MSDSGLSVALAFWGAVPAQYPQGVCRLSLHVMQVGTAQLFAFPAAIMPNGGTAPIASLVGIAGILGTFGGLLLLVGLFTRPVAFVLSGEMAVAYFYGHAPQGFWPVLNQGAPAVLYCFLFLYFSAAGAGPWSLDAKRGK